MTLINKIITACVTMVLCASFVVGCNYGKSRVHCPTYTTTTTHIYDTTTHIIYDTLPWYVIHMIDSTVYTNVNIPINIDTNAVVKAYYTKYKYDRQWSDSNLVVDMTDVITQNKPIDNIFKYKLLKPQVVNYTNVDNTIHYNKYLYIGATMPIVSKDINNCYGSLDLIYASPIGYAGMSYSSNMHTYSVKLGIKLFSLI